MDISFSAIAFELKYSSLQIEEIYSTLSIFDKGSQKVPAWLLSSIKFLPVEFTKHVSTYGESVNIIFEPRSTPNDKVKFDDWDLIEI
jgi:hypothetical protein